MTNGTRRWLPWGLLIAHLGAMVFGLIGMLVMLPNPHLWNEDPLARDIFTWSMDNAGATHIVLGAAAMFVTGGYLIGWAKTTTFFVVSCALSLTSELLGTTMGFPFGNYEYTDFLGYKVLGHVPYSIPLSWFYVGFAGYLIGTTLAHRLRLPSPSVMAVLLGVWFLTVWDLVLDPAMAHESLRIQFWIWDETGPYFGMPIKNFVGWAFTGLLFMALSRLLWRRDVVLPPSSLTIPFIIYASNLIFAMVLSGAVDLWTPIIVSALLGMIPAALTLYRGSSDPAGEPQLARNA